MTDYRNYVKAKLAALDQRREEIEAERQRLMAALNVMDEADATDQIQPGGNGGRPDITSAPDRILDVLRAAGGPLAAADLYTRLGDDIERPLVHSALYRLKRRGTVFKSGKRMWCLAGRDDDLLHHEPPQPTLSG